MNENEEQIAESAAGLLEWRIRRKLPDGHPQSPTVFIRPLELDDANTSWQWRNNPDIWRLTGNRPDRYVTPEVEREWLAAALGRSDERRFAICLKEDDRYIGNVFYTRIADHEAEPHVFIGDPSYWGKGIASDASLLLHDYGFSAMGLERIRCTVDSSNVAMLRLCYSLGHVKIAEEHDDKFKGLVTRFVLTKRTYLAYTKLDEVLETKW